MFRSLFGRRLTPTVSQLEIPFDEGGALLARLRRLGLVGIERVTLTRNRSTMVSFRGSELRLHRLFREATEDQLRAVVVFVGGRGVARRVARKLLREIALPAGERRSARRERTHPDDRPWCDRLTEEHARLNADRFGGILQPMAVRLSRRMRSRLGHYSPARSPGGAEIAISRRHLRRHGWEEALDTLLHEMVHQWQDENGFALDHGVVFRRKAKEVGAVPRARRPVDKVG